MPASSVNRYVPDDSVLGITVGQTVSLSAEVFDRLSTAPGRSSANSSDKRWM
jgi:hypothetical protein